MKDTEKIIKMLRSHRMGCFGCGYEHNCRDNGCALMQMAANELEKLTHHTEPENKPLTLEQLKRMDREPVWVKEIDGTGCGEWTIIDIGAQTEMLKALSPDTGYEEYNYGKTWLAYVRKPEGSET